MIVDFQPHIVLTDLNGVDWAFDSPGCPIGLISIEGLQGAPFDFDKTTAVGQAGVTVIARNDKESTVSMKLQVGPMARGDHAVTVLRQFLHGLGRGWARGGRMMRLTVLETGRFQDVRLASRLSAVDWTKLFHTGLLKIDVEVQSDESWWRTDPVDVTFTPSEFAGATIDNASTVDGGVWPWWRVDGPITGLHLGVAGEDVAVPINLSAGQWIEIDTDPVWWGITDQAGNDRTWGVDRWFERVPSTTSAAPVSVPVKISGSGTSSSTRVRLVVPQVYEAAL